MFWIVVVVVPAHGEPAPAKSQPPLAPDDSRKSSDHGNATHHGKALSLSPLSPLLDPIEFAAMDAFDRYMQCCAMNSQTVRQIPPEKNWIGRLNRTDGIGQDWVAQCC
jgi:hypothetical protein